MPLPFFCLFIMFSLLANSITAQIRVEPQGGISRFQDSLLRANDTLRRFITNKHVVIACYDIALKKGKVKQIALTAQVNLVKQADLILKSSLNAGSWGHLSKNQQKRVCRVVFWFRSSNTQDSARTNADSISNISKETDNDEVDAVEVELPNSEAEYPGGYAVFKQFLAEQLNLPEQCIKKKLITYANVRFLINTDGSIGNIRMTTLNGGCTEVSDELMRVIKQSEPWIPSVINKRFVKAYREVPVRFDFR